MDPTLVEQVTKALQIRAVLLRTSSLTSNPDFLPPLNTDLELAVQFRSTPPTTVQVTSIVDDGTPITKLAVFLFSAAVRLVDQRALNEARERGGEIVEGDVKLEIVAEFGAHYEILNGADLEEMGPSLAAYCQHNVGFHVWPYWREFVHSTCSRMSLPLIPVPMYQIKR